MVFEKMKETKVAELRSMAENGNVAAQRIVHKYNNDFAMVSLKEVIALVLICIVIGYVFPIGLVALTSMNTTGLDAGTIGLLAAFPIIIVIIVFIKITE